MAHLIKQWFSFSGRIRRSHFLVGVVISFLILLWAFCGAPLPHFLWVVIPGAVVLTIRYVLYATAKVAGTIAITSLHVRRLHDRNLSGWWMVLATLWYVCGGFLALRFHGSAAIAAVTLLPIPTWILSLLPGSKGENKYGQNPKPQKVEE